MEEAYESVEDVTSWLQEKGFSEDIIVAFKGNSKLCTYVYGTLSSSLNITEQEMDGEAIAAVFATSPGPDCLKDVLPKLGQRLKVYNALKTLYEQFQVSPRD